eukprot:39167-Prymnesium_polylepis.1
MQTSDEVLPTISSVSALSGVSTAPSSSIACVDRPPSRARCSSTRRPALVPSETRRSCSSSRSCTLYAWPLSGLRAPVAAGAGAGAAS